MEPTDFVGFDLKPRLLAAITKIGYTKPTVIQQEVIPYLMSEEKKDLVALAQTGSGKTAAFGIPLAQKLDPANDQVQALILSPTRELAAQIQETLKPLVESVGLRSMTVYGGQSYNDQRASIRLKPQIVIATPGRLVDLLNQKTFSLSNLRVLVLDEADRMLSMGFEEDLQFILDCTHQKSEETQRRAACQTWLFSATMGPGIKRILNRYLTNPKIIEQLTGNSGVSSTLEHQYLAVKSGFRPQALMQILKTLENFYGIIFCQTKKEVSEVETMLLQNKISCMSLHGDKVQKDRERVLKLLKEEKFSVLIATDVAARGLDVKNLKNVVHYSIPMEIDSYIHRSGRTGRNGEEGLVVSILEPRDFSKLNRLSRTANIKMKPFELVNPEAWLEKQATKELEKMAKFGVDTEAFQSLKKFCEKSLLTLDTTLFSTADWMAAFLMTRLSVKSGETQGFVIKDIKAPSAGGDRRPSFTRERDYSSGGGRGRPASRGGYDRGGRDDFRGRDDRGRGDRAPRAEGRSASAISQIRSSTTSTGERRPASSGFSGGGSPRPYGGGGTRRPASSSTGERRSYPSRDR